MRRPPQSLHSRQLCYVCSVICVEKEILDKLAGGALRVSWETGSGGWPALQFYEPLHLALTQQLPGAGTSPTQHSNPKRGRELWEITTLLGNYWRRRHYFFQRITESLKPHKMQGISYQREVKSRRNKLRKSRIKTEGNGAVTGTPRCF